MPPKVKSLWGNLRIELHFVKNIPLKKVGTILAASLMFLGPPLLNIVLQKRTYGESFMVPPILFSKNPPQPYNGLNPDFQIWRSL